MVFGSEEFLAASNVSRETLARLERYAQTLAAWNSRQNLVSAASLEALWHRHIWDSAQLQPLIPPAAQSLVDLGAGAGFPALVLACLLREREGFRTVLYESVAKKCRFLEAAAAAMDLEVEIRPCRIEEAAPEPFDVVTARACAPLEKLLSYAERFQAPETVNLFLKGQSAEAELTVAAEYWRMHLERRSSQTAPSATIFIIREIRHAGSERRRRGR
jgi:16S rRNA (guanine527-N7)-methyltransferase